MKDKKLKKIVREVLNEVREYDRPIKAQMYTGDWAEYDEEVSEKLKTMLLNIYLDSNNGNKKSVSN